MDGIPVSLKWFYADDGFAYNEDFSVLTDDTPA